MKEPSEILHGNGCISRFTYKLPMYLNVEIANLTTFSQTQVQSYIVLVQKALQILVIQCLPAGS